MSSFDIRFDIDAPGIESKLQGVRENLGQLVGVLMHIEKIMSLGYLELVKLNETLRRNVPPQSGRGLKATFLREDVVMSRTVCVFGVAAGPALDDDVKNGGTRTITAKDKDGNQVNFVLADGSEVDKLEFTGDVEDFGEVRILKGIEGKFILDEKDKTGLHSDPDQEFAFDAKPPESGHAFAATMKREEEVPDAPAPEAAEASHSHRRSHHKKSED